MGGGFLLWLLEFQLELIVDVVKQVNQCSFVLGDLGVVHLGVILVLEGKVPIYNRVLKANVKWLL